MIKILKDFSFVEMENRLVVVFIRENISGICV